MAANDGTDNVLMEIADMTTGAFTFEAMIRLDFDPLASMPNRTGRLIAD